MRAVRATLAMPGLFALTSEVIGTPADDGVPEAGGGRGGFMSACPSRSAQRGQEITGPAAKVAELRQLPWWR